MAHNFGDSLAKSHAYANAPWWEPVYRAAFPNFGNMMCVRHDGWAQRGGIDRVINLLSGKTVKTDEKVREEDWPDILWEYWSARPVRDPSEGKPGWCCKDQACDYIAYAFVPSQTCYLLPALQMRKAWREHGRQWIRLGRSEDKNGFRIVEADNGSYITESVAVPIRETLDAIRDAMVVGWTDTDQQPGGTP